MIMPLVPGPPPARFLDESNLESDRAQGEESHRIFWHRLYLGLPG